MGLMVIESRPGPLEVVGACAIWFVSASLLGGAIYATQRSFSGESIVYLVQGVALGIVGGPVFAALSYLAGRNGISLVRAAVTGSVAATAYVVLLLAREPADSTMSTGFEVGLALTFLGVGAALGVVTMLALLAFRRDP